jgi:hypothetical protein
MHWFLEWGDLEPDIFYRALFIKCIGQKKRRSGIIHKQILSCMNEQYFYFQDTRNIIILILLF